MVTTSSRPKGRLRHWLYTISNPMLVRELRGRMRGSRAFAVLTAYLVLLSCFTTVIYYVNKSSVTSYSSGVSAMADMGKALFASVVLVELFMVTFITPAFTAGAISGEKERKTYEVLRTTLLPAHKLVSGKLAAALTYMFLLILAAVPLESLAFVLGGVVVEELVLALILLSVTAFFFAALGLFFSSLVRRTLVSTVLSYTVALLVTIGLPVLVVIFIFGLLDVPYGYGWVWETVVAYGVFLLAGLSPIPAAVLTELMLEQENTLLVFWYPVSSSRQIPVLSPWIIYTVIYLVVALLLLLATVLRVRRQVRR